MSHSLLIITPIYKPGISDTERICLLHSLKRIEQTVGHLYQHSFVCSPELDVTHYKTIFPRSTFSHFSSLYFESRISYNQLCYTREFYEKFMCYKLVLILQLDAVILNPSLLGDWIKADYYFVGAPECYLHTYDLSPIEPFNSIGEGLKTVSLQGLNGGLSLRSPSKCILALEEYPMLTEVFKNYGGGIGEDIFFSLMSRVSKKSLVVPTEIEASMFSLTGFFEEWIKFNGERLPFGLHAWEKSEYAQEIVKTQLIAAR